MNQLIDKVYRILNACKGFTAGYSSDTASKGYFYIEHEGKAYDHDTAANVVGWAQVASVMEEYELDGFELYITE